MLPARHLTAMLDKPDTGAEERELVTLAEKVEAAWNQMIPRIDENKRQRGESPEELTAEENEHVADSEQANKELDEDLARVTHQAETADEIVELMLPLYEDEIRFWQDITRDPKNIHPDDKAVIDEILTKQQELVDRLQEFLADAD